MFAPLCDFRRAGARELQNVGAGELRTDPMRQLGGVTRARLPRRPGTASNQAAAGGPRQAPRPTDRRDDVSCAGRALRTPGLDIRRTRILRSESTRRAGRRRVGFSAASLPVGGGFSSQLAPLPR